MNIQLNNIHLRFFTGLLSLFSLPWLLTLSVASAQTTGLNGINLQGLAVGGKSVAPAPGNQTTLPKVLSYQGFLTDQATGAPVTATMSGTFKLYDALTGGNLLYAESQRLTVVNGLINVQIGSITAFPALLVFDKPYWLEVTVGSDILSPRQPIASTAFAQSAARLVSRKGFETAAGDNALNPLSTGAGNVAFGANALSQNTSGYSNTALGNSALRSSTTGTNNIAIGESSGVQLISGSNDIYIGNQGAGSAESNTLRIGAGGVQTKTFLAGVRGVVPAQNDGQPVVIDSSGQLGNVPNIFINSAGLSFGNSLGQMLNLWGTQYGVGIQNGALYSRSDDSFFWYGGGTHSDAKADAGGGTMFMSLNKLGLLINGDVFGKSFNSTSDRNVKENFADINARDVLKKVVALPLHTWNYRDDEHKVKHLGPVAQDFHAAFNIGPDDKHIAMVDADGVAIAAIQGLYQMLQEKDAVLRAQGEEIARLKLAVEQLLAQSAATTRTALGR